MDSRPVTRRRRLAAAFLASGILILSGSAVFAQFGAVPPDRSSLLEDGAMHVVICGSGAPLPSADRAQACTAVIADGRIFLVDVGSGSLENLRLWGIPLESLAGVLLTHFHSDHIADVGQTIFSSWVAGRAEPLDIYGPVGVERVVEGFLIAYELDSSYRIAHHGEDLLPPAGAKAEARTIDLSETAPSRVFYEEDGLVITAFLVDHEPIAPAVGYRFDFGGRSVVLSGDTVHSANLVAASQGVDVLVHEVLSDDVMGMAAQALSAGGNERTGQIVKDTLDYHIYPADLHALAAEAGVGLLVLSHLAPPLPPAQADAVFLRGRAEDAPNDALVAVDGTHIALPADSEERTVDTF